MADCNPSDCSGCSSASTCGMEKPNMLVEHNPHSSIKKIIAVVSGKGGVGKSLVTSLLSVAMNKKGHRVAVLDADITGPSIPKAFGIKGGAYGTQEGIIPPKSKGGIDIMSVNVILKNETDPVLWRGPIIASTVQQFWTDVVYKDVDYMFIDMPPGTGDVALTVFQNIPIDGIVIVTSPQELVAMIVDKAYKMAEMMNIPILGMVENLSYFHCEDNGKDYKIFGESHIDEIAEEKGIEVVSKIPINPEFANKVDKGKVEEIDQKWLDNLVEHLEGEV